jgi:hypothetical protein
MHDLVVAQGRRRYPEVAMRHASEIDEAEINYVCALGEVLKAVITIPIANGL